MIVEGSGRVADVIAQVANLPVAKITIALIQKKLSVLFHDTYELFTESKLVEWTKKVSPLQAPLSFRRPKGSQGSWPMSSKGPSRKFKAHLPPAILIIVLVGTPRAQALLLHCLLPLGGEGVFVTSPCHEEDTAEGFCRRRRGVRNCPAQCRGLWEAAGRSCCCSLLAHGSPCRSKT